MLNNAWPENYWNLFDYYLNPGGPYFGVRKATAPLHVMYSYTDRSIWVVNSRYVPAGSHTASAAVYHLNGTLLYSHDHSVASVGADAVAELFTLPSDVRGISTTYFLRL